MVHTIRVIANSAKILSPTRSTISRILAHSEVSLFWSLLQKISENLQISPPNEGTSNSSSSKSNSIDGTSNEFCIIRRYVSNNCGEIFGDDTLGLNGLSYSFGGCHRVSLVFEQKKKRDPFVRIRSVFVRSPFPRNSGEISAFVRSSYSIVSPRLFILRFFSKFIK